MKNEITKDWCMNMAAIEDGQEVGAGALARPCFCVGPQNGEPLCPCRMAGIKIRDGRYIQPEKDLGPVTTTGRDSDG